MVAALPGNYEIAKICCCLRNIDAITICVISTEGRNLDLSLTRFSIRSIAVAVSNQRIFLLPPPFLDFFFPRQCCVYVAGFFEVDKLINVILFGETFYQLVFVLEDAALQVIGDADIYDSIVPVRQNVNVVMSIVRHNSRCVPKG
jgi:hypothetical protein